VRNNILNRFKYLFLTIVAFCSIQHAIAQNIDTNKINLKYPIQDRNTDFLITKPSTNIDLKDPKIVDKKIEYDPKTNKFVVYEKIGDTYYKTPTYMTYDEYLAYTSQQSEQTYFQQRSRAIDLAERKTKQPFLYQGPELFNRFLGGTKIEIKPQGSVDVTIGVNSQRIDNPVLLQNQRRNINFDFDMNIQLGLQASIGDKLKLGINYNTKSGFAFENQLKLGYKGKEDDIIQALEFGNVSLPLRSALIKGPQNLFGVKTQLKFGRLTITNVLSQQKSKTENVRIENGAQTKKFAIKADEYEDNRHFFLAQYFRDSYEKDLKRLPFVGSQTVINRIEVWITNKTRQTEEVREIVAFQDLGETSKKYNNTLGGSGTYPENNSNNLYNIITRSANAQNFRDPSKCISFLESNNLFAVDDFEKTSARKLASTEYYFNPQLGYISLNQQLRPDEVLGVAIQYTVNGKVYQLGEFATDLPPLADTTKTKDQILALKMLKATSIRTTEPIWDLMMKNVYSLNAYNVSQDQFFFDIYYIDPGGGQKRYLPEDPGPNAVAGLQLLKVLNLDNLNNQLDPQNDGRFDFIPNVTISPRNGKIYFPVLEPFGSSLAAAIGNTTVADKYVYRYLYDTTKTAAQQFPEFNRFVMKGSYRGTDNSTFRLPGAFNLPQGSVSVSAGGNLLKENIDYTVNYGIGEVVIINQGVLNSGIPIDIKFENNILFGVVNKSLFGTRLDYAVNKKFNIGFTHLRLAEKPFTQKVNFNDDPIKNNIFGIDFNYETESKGLTRAFNKITAQDTKAPSKIAASGEAAYFKPGHAKAINIDDAGTVYVDDFEGSSTTFDLRGSYLTWSLASAPKGMLNTFGSEKFPEARVNDSIVYGLNRAKLSWYSIDPIFQGGGGGTNPLDNATSAATQNNIYTRQFYTTDVFKNRQNSNTITNPPLFTLDLSYFPNERGPFNYETQPTVYSKGVNPNGTLRNPETRWAGIMRNIEGSTDFEAANIEFIQFWVLDPFKFPGVTNRNGNLYIQLGNVSEDILKDSRKQYENGLPRPNGGTTVDTTVWGVTPTIQNALTNSFDADPDVIKKQDVGLDGLDNDAEKNYFSSFLSKVPTVITDANEIAKLNADPSGDDYVFNRDGKFAGSDGVITRYKNFSNTQGNSSNNLNGGNVNGNSKTQPDNEDLNNDNTLNETEEYFQYKIPFTEDFLNNSPYVTAKQPVDSSTNPAYWYQIKIPVKEFESRVGGIADFRSIRFARMLLADFTDSVTLRFAEFGLVRNQWRKYDLSLSNPGEQLPSDDVTNTDFSVTSVSVEENTSRAPIPYAIPPGISREQNISGYNNTLQNEQAMSIQVCELKDGDARAVFKTTNLDLRNYKRIKLFTHAENYVGDKGSAFPIKDNDVHAFMRIGSDFTDNYYEYEIPLKVTQPGNYNPNSDGDRRLIWPDSNQMNILLDSLTKVKQLRNTDGASQLLPYDVTMANGVKISLKGNPDLGQATVMMIGIKNPRKIIGENEFTDDGQSKCAEIWVNELRMAGFDEQGGWAALGRVDIQLGNLGNIILAGNMHTIGFGDLEQRLNQRYRDNYYQYDIATNLQLGNLLPEKVGLKIPVYAQFSQTISTPQYDPYELDVELKDAYATIDASSLSKEEKKAQKEKIKDRSQDVTTIKSVNVTNLQKVRTNSEKQPRIYDVENFNVSYAYTQTSRHNPIIENEVITKHRGSLGWNFSPKALYWQPLKKLKNNSIHLKPIKEFNLNLKPNSIAFRTDINRQYGSSKIRDIGEDSLVILPTYDKYFTWDRFWSIKYSITKSINLDFTANNKARIDEPYGAIDTKEKRDTLRRNFWKFGRNTNYDHIFNASYTLPLNLFPAFDWMSVKARYGATYNWIAAPLGLSSLGNTIKNGQDYQFTADFNFKNLYQKSKFLKPYTLPEQKKSKQEYTEAIAKYNQLEVDAETKIIKKKDDIEKKIEDIERAEKDTSKTKEDIKLLVAEKKQLKNDLRQLKLDKRRLQQPANPKLDAVIRPLLLLQRASFSYDVKRTTILPGFMPTPLLLGQDFKNKAPGAAFLFGAQKDTNWLNDIAAKGHISNDTSLNYQFIQTKQTSFNLKVSLEPFRDFRIDITMQKTQGENYAEFFKTTSANSPYQHLTPQTSGNMSMSFLMLRTIFSKVDENNFSNAFFTFQSLREKYSQKFGAGNLNSDSIYILNDTIRLPNFKEGYGPFSQDVLLPSLLAAYTGKNPDKVKLNPLRMIPLPNWRLSYNGIAKTKWGKKLFTSFNITHGYNSTFNIGSYVTNLNYVGTPGYFNEDLYNVPQRIDSLSGNYYAYYLIPQVTITEQLSPLLGVEISWKNSLITNFEFKKSRTLGLSFLDYRLTETRTTEYVAAVGYKIAKFKIPFKIKGKRITLQNDINLRADFSYRDDKTVNYRLDQNIAEPTRGQKSISLAATIDYIVNNKLNVRLFYDFRRTTPATLASYPTRTHRGGITFRFSLTP
jgi:cell surface protein SprA